MITTYHKVSYQLRGEERVVLETQDLKLAKKKDAELEMAGSLLMEAERLIKAGKVNLPKGVKLDSLESTLEELFMEFAANQEGMKRAMRGQAYTEVEDQSKPEMPRRGGGRKASPRED